MEPENVKVTTTPSFDGIKIIQYLQPVTAHVVVGMNLFKDMFTNLTDIFGGHSETYTKTLEAINEKVIIELQTKAHKLGANCILGLKIDNDEIASKGKSMMMVSAIGTAAIADFSKDYLVKNKNTTDEINEKELMKKYNITFVNDTYFYKNYKYKKLIDAINYAKLDENHKC